MRGVVIAVAAALLLAGCGQKGNLYRPAPEEPPGQSAGQTADKD